MSFDPGRGHQREEGPGGGTAAASASAVRPRPAATGGREGRGAAGGSCGRGLIFCIRAVGVQIFWVLNLFAVGDPKHSAYSDGLKALAGLILAGAAERLIAPSERRASSASIFAI